MIGSVPTRRNPSPLAAALGGLLILSSIAIAGFGGVASGQTTVEDDDCTFSVAPSSQGKNWWELSVSCEFTGWDFIDMQGFGLRGSQPVSVPPECKKYADQTYPDGQRFQGHVCGPAGLGTQPEPADRFLSGAVKLKVNPNAAGQPGFSARTVAVKLYYSSHPALHGGGGLAAEVEIKVPKKWTEPRPDPTPSESPEPSPSMTPSPSPSPDGPMLVLTKTVDPKKVPDRPSDELLGHKVVWTITLRNAGTDAYEGALRIADRLPDIWNLYPVEARAAGAMGFTGFGAFYEDTRSVVVRPAGVEGDPAWVGMNRHRGSGAESRQCEFGFGAGRTTTADSEVQIGASTVDDWKDLTPAQIFRSKRAEKLTGSAELLCVAYGRIEPGEEVVVKVTARREPGDRSADVKTNLADASWTGGEAKARATVELEGINSVLEDIDKVVPLGRPFTRWTGSGPGEGIFGTEFADELVGTARSDVLMGHYGSDVLRGLAGVDVISGGVGNDVIQGGRGRDGLIGGSGKDVIQGGDGDDVLVGGPDKDELFGGPGDDRIEARDGERDIVDCGGGRDTAIVDKEDTVRNCEKVRRGT